MSAIREAINQLCTTEQAIQADLVGRVAQEILSGEATPAQIGAFLVGLRIRGEGPDHLIAFAQAMRGFAAPVGPIDRDGLVDTCGTGGDSMGTFNISTAAAIVAAGAGARIAKHGNRAVTSSPGSGSADVLAALGVKIECPPETSLECLKACGLAFFFAPAYHGAMRHAGPARREIGTRTILNLLGPLANPAGARRQVVGVGSPELTQIFAQVLAGLDAEHVMIVHGSDGLDEITLTGPTYVCEAVGNEVIPMQTIQPEEFGYKRCKLQELAGGETAEERAAIIRAILAGEPGPRREVTALNAAAALKVGGLAADLRKGCEMAEEAIDTGSAQKVLDVLVRISNGIC